MLSQHILEYAEKKEYRAICLANHLWDSRVAGASDWYRGQDIPHLLQALPLPQSNKVRFLFGCEIEYLGQGRISLKAEHFSLFDFIIISVNHMHMEGLIRPPETQAASEVAALFTQRLEELVSINDLPWEKIGIAHINAKHLYRPGCAADVLSLCDRKRLSSVFRKVSTLGGGIELNASAFLDAKESLNVHLELFNLAREAGCRFYCASDAHTTESLDLSPLHNIITQLGLTKKNQFIPRET